MRGVPSLSKVWVLLACPIALSSQAHNLTQAPADTPTRSAHTWVALDDAALQGVSGAGVDTALLREMGGMGGERRNERHDAASSPDQAPSHDQAALRSDQQAALVAALAFQTQVAPRLATLAVNTVNTAAAIGGTLIALPPATVLAPIGLPLFGLPALPKQEGR